MILAFLAGIVIGAALAWLVMLYLTIKQESR